MKQPLAPITLAAPTMLVTCLPKILSIETCHLYRIDTTDGKDA